MLNLTTLTGAARVAGVMGWPVSHSKSPMLHRTWLTRYGIDGAYVPLAVAPQNLADAVRGLPALGFSGANVTIPHKEAVVAMMDRLTPTAARLGAVNTIIIEPDRSLLGDNTDGFGFIENLKSDPAGWTGRGGHAVVLGAGGAARAICAALIDEGMNRISVINRSRDKAVRIAADFGSVIEPRPWTETDLSFALKSADLLVNTTALGMIGQPDLSVDMALLPDHATVTDIVYNPLQTAFLMDAAARGLRVVDGLGMLLHQGRPGFRAWFGLDPEVTDEVRTAVLGGS